MSHLAGLILRFNGATDLVAVINSEHPSPNLTNRRNDSVSVFVTSIALADSRFTICALRQ